MRQDVAPRRGRASAGQPARLASRMTRRKRHKAPRRIKHTQGPPEGVTIKHMDDPDQGSPVPDEPEAADPLKERERHSPERGDDPDPAEGEVQHPSW